MHLPLSCVLLTNGSFYQCLSVFISGENCFFGQRSTWIAPPAGNLRACRVFPVDDLFGLLSSWPRIEITEMPASRKTSKSARISSAALPAEALGEGQEFPEIDLPLQPPYPPAEARPVKDVPRGPEWLYEPKWDGFRCLAFRSGDEVILQSKAGQPLTRYFPELVQALRSLPARGFVLDGEIVVRSSGGGAESALDFNALLQRIHPAATRIQRLSRETPATYMVFDLLVDDRAQALTGRPLSARRDRLQDFAERVFYQTGGDQP